MEAVGAATSILAIAGAGIQISLKLIAFADQVGTAPKRIQDVGTDVSVTAATLHELGELMRKTPTKRSAGLFNPDQVQNIVASSARCKEIFDELKDILGRASQQLRGIYKSTAKSHIASSKIKLSTLERWKWPFLQPSMKPLQDTLNGTKVTLTLILQVVHLRHAHTTASLDREEQTDLVRIIAAMKRQQLASVHDDIGGSKGLDFGITEESDSEGSSEAQTALEAWSVTPNTFADDAFQHFKIQPVPVSQQQIADLLKISPQDCLEVASVIDSLSIREQDAILGEVLDMRHSRSVDSTIRSISAKTWTGSHDLFGKVTGRKFTLVIERQVKSSKITRAGKQIRGDRESLKKAQDYFPYTGSSDSDYIRERIAYRRHASISPPPRDHRRRSGTRHHAPPIASHERKRPISDNVRKRKQESKEQELELDTMIEKARMKQNYMEYQHGFEKADSLPRTEPQPASESSDDDLVKSLLAQYTNFDPGEPLVQVFATPPPAYEETFVIPKRAPRPY